MDKKHTNISLRPISIALGGGIGAAIGTVSGLITSIAIDDIALWMFALPALGLISGLGIGWIISNG